MCCLLNAFGNHYELQLIFVQEINFFKCVQVRVVLYTAVSSLKSLQKSFLSFVFQALPLYIIPSKPM